MQRQVSASGDQKEILSVEIKNFIGWFVLIGAYKPKNIILLQLWGKEVDSLQQNYEPSEVSKTPSSIAFSIVSVRREIRNDEKAESWREIF